MKPITELVRNLTNKHKDVLDKQKEMAEKMIKTAEAAKAAGRKK